MSTPHPTENETALPSADHLRRLFVIEATTVEAERVALEGRAPAFTLTPDSGGTAAAIQLGRANHVLWHLENLARRPGATDAELGRVKRSIDPWNLIRHRCVEAFDKAVVRAFPWAVELDARPKNSETPGSIADRLSIQILKLHSLAPDTADGPTDGDPAEPTVLYLRLAHQDLLLAFDELLALLQSRARGLRPYWACKCYDDPRANPHLRTDSTTEG
jgi:hypothetical protein